MRMHAVRRGGAVPRTKATKPRPAAAVKVRRSTIETLQRTLGNRDTSRVVRSGALSDVRVTPAEATPGRVGRHPGSGQALPSSARGFFEPRLQTDLGAVRLHTDDHAARATDRVGARAFTLGRDIYFNRGAFDQSSHGGQHLLAHELVHVVQQTGFRAPGGSPFGATRSAGTGLSPSRPSITPTARPVIQRGEKATQVWRVGPLDAYQASKDADTARRAAKASGLPGPWNGPRDAFRHAIWNCLMAKSIGKGQAKTVADTHEEFGKNHPNEKAMDDHNNAVGRSAGVTAKGKDCADLVAKAMKDGKLRVIPNYTAVASTSGKSPPKTPVASNLIKWPPIATKKARYDKTGYAGSGYQ